MSMITAHFKSNICQVTDVNHQLCLPSSLVSLKYQEDPIEVWKNYKEL